MLWRDLRAWQIYGANTDVGKTILSTILCKALARRASTNGLLYLKPVSTGPQNEADDRHIQKYAPNIISRCISQFAQPVSPHLAARDFGPSQNVSSTDAAILSKTKGILNDHSRSGGRYALLETAGGVLSPGPSGTVQADLYRPLRLPTLLMGDSKLGGIGTTISAFESLHIRGYDVESVLLFDDPKWGNHGYLQEHFAKHDIQAFSLPLPPPRRENEKDDQVVLSEYYDECSSSPTIDKLVALLHQKHFSRVSKLTSMPSHADEIIWHPFRQHQLPQNVIAIDSAYDDHFETYNQESDASLNVPESSSPTGLTPLSSVTPQPSLLTPLFDASASWWTQGLGHGNPTLSLTAAYAAGRYGHIMFANTVHEPALDLCYNLLSTLQNPRLSRVFFTDNGSTGMEVAVKMALRASCQRYGWNKDDSEQPIGIIGLKGSYHGDTIGVMNCSEPCTFNEKVDWYRPWGYWFEPPEVRMKQGQWQIKLPSEMSSTTKTFSSLDAVFDFDARQSDAEFYQNHITKTLTNLTQKQRLRFGALILEPLIMGAGGMIFVDPLFQRTMITTIRSNPSIVNPDYQSSNPHIANNQSKSSPQDWSGLPFIADEVFTGLYRLGRPSSSSFLNSSAVESSTYSSDDALDNDTAPDISVHAKLLTGGLLPLALTTASASIFNTFLSDSKADALLHGHSYTAHAVGCAVANKSLEIMGRMHQSSSSSSAVSPSSPPASSSGDAGTEEREGGEWAAYKQAWRGSTTTTASSTGGRTNLFSFFNPDTLTKLSHHTRVDSCFAIGTILALTLKPKDPSSSSSGYNSNAAASLQANLLKAVPTIGDTDLGAEAGGVHSRILGDVIYFMTSLTTKPEQVTALERAILRALDMEI